LLWQRSVLLAALPSPTTEWCKPRWRRCGTRFSDVEAFPDFLPSVVAVHRTTNSGWHKGVAWDESRYSPFETSSSFGSGSQIHYFPIDYARHCRTVKVNIQYTKSYGCFEQSTSTYTFTLFPCETNDDMCRMEVSVAWMPVSVLSRENLQ